MYKAQHRTPSTKRNICITIQIIAFIAIAFLLWFSCTQASSQNAIATDTDASKSQKIVDPSKEKVNNVADKKTHNKKRTVKFNSGADDMIYLIVRESTAYPMKGSGWSREVDSSSLYLYVYYSTAIGGYGPEYYIIFADENDYIIGEQTLTLPNELSEDYGTKYVTNLTLNGQEITNFDQPYDLSSYDTVEVTQVIADDPAKMNYNFIANGGKWSDQEEIKTIVQSKGNHYAFPDEDPSKDNRHFVGWFLNNAQIRNTNYCTTNTDQSVYAQWKNIITYMPNGPEASELQQDKIEDKDATLYDDYVFSWDNHKLVGWNTQADGKGQHYDLNTVYTENKDLTLYAEWEGEANLSLTNGDFELPFWLNYYENDTLMWGNYTKNFDASINWKDSFTYNFVAEKGSESAKLILTIDDNKKYELDGFGDGASIIHSIKMNGTDMTEGSGDVEITADGHAAFECNMGTDGKHINLLGKVQNSSSPIAGAVVSIANADGQEIANTTTDETGYYFTYVDEGAPLNAIVMAQGYISGFHEYTSEEIKQPYTEFDYTLTAGTTISINQALGNDDYTLEITKNGKKIYEKDLDNLDFAVSSAAQIDVKEKMLTVSDGGQANADALVYKFSANDHEGYTFDAWKIDNEKVKDGYTRTVGANNVQIGVDYNKNPEVNPEYIDGGWDGDSAAQTGDFSPFVICALMMMAASASVVLVARRKSLIRK